MTSAIIGKILCVIALPFLIACGGGQGIPAVVPSPLPAITTALPAATASSHATTTAPATATRVTASPTTRATASPMRAMIGTRYSLTLGESVTVPDSVLTVRFREILDDSRCPKNLSIVCTWAGEAHVVFETNAGPEIQTFTLRMPSMTNETTVRSIDIRTRTESFSYVIQITSLEPQPDEQRNQTGTSSATPTARVLIAPSSPTATIPRTITTPTIGAIVGRYTLPLDGAVTLPDRATTIRFTGVTGDSRCPISNVVCIWAGEATVVFTITSGEITKPFTLIMPDGIDDTTLYDDYPQARVIIQGYVIQIVRLSPQRTSSDVPPKPLTPTPTPPLPFATIQVTTLP